MNPRQLEKAWANKARDLARQRVADQESSNDANDGSKMTVSLPPAPASQNIPPKEKPETCGYITDRSGYDVANENTLSYFSLELFADIAQRQLDTGIEDNVFRLLCATAIGQGGISVQEIVENFGDIIPRNVERNTSDWPLPAPDVQRALLTRFTLIQEDDFSGSKLSWQHSQSPQSSEAPMPPN